MQEYSLTIWNIHHRFTIILVLKKEIVPHVLTELYCVWQKRILNRFSFSGVSGFENPVAWQYL